MKSVKHTIYDLMDCLEFVKAIFDGDSYIWQDVRKVGCQQSSEGSDEPDPLRSSSIKPVEAMHSILGL